MDITFQNKRDNEYEIPSKVIRGMHILGMVIDHSIMIITTLLFYKYPHHSLQSPAVQGQSHSQTSLLPRVQSDLLPGLPEICRVCSVGLHCQTVNGHLFIEKQQALPQSRCLKPKFHLGVQVS